MRNDLILISLFCLLLLLMLPAASGKIMIDLPLLPRQQLPIDIPFLENISVGGVTPSYDDGLHDGAGVLYGDLIVGKGRVVSLKNYSLFFNCYYDGQYKIDVRNGGSQKRRHPDDRQLEHLFTQWRIPLPGSVSARRSLLWKIIPYASTG